MKKLFLIVLIHVSFLNADLLNAQIITTCAGTGSAGFSGDGGPAVSATMIYPLGITVDVSGNVFFCDEYNHRIRKINAVTGNISTVAGNGSGSYSGDGGSATAAAINSPFGVTFDAAGNMYIADYNNNRVRKVSTGGIITTIAGTGVSGYSGDGGAATSAMLDSPTAVAVDASGNLFISDRDNHRIRKITGGIISTCVGTGTAGYSGDGGLATAATMNQPNGITFDSAGNLYIADYNNRCVRKVNTSGIISTFAGTGVGGFSGDGGQATAATFYNPSGVAADGAGNVYIIDVNNGRVRKVNTSGIINTVAGNGTYGYSGDGGNPTLAQFKNPFCLAVDGTGNIYISDTYGLRIRKVDPTASAGIKEFSLASAANVYPNPNNGLFSISINEFSPKIELEIYNLLGEKVKSLTLNNTITAIELTGSPGIYSYRVISENKCLANGKIIIQ